MPKRLMQMTILSGLAAVTIALVFSLNERLAGVGDDPELNDAAPVSGVTFPNVTTERLVPHGGIVASGRGGDAALTAAVSLLKQQDFAGALGLAEPLAEQGDATAQHIAGYIYEHGLVGERDLGRAESFYQRAAAAGLVDGEYSYALMLINPERQEELFPGQDEIAEANYQRAAGYFRKVAAKGDPRGYTQLSGFYADGLGVAKDETVALALIEKAAALNEPQALFLVGMGHLTGIGRDQDYQLAEQNLASAVSAGHVEAAYNLALIYRSAVLGAPDLEKAASIMQAAAEAGYGPALTAMGLYAHRGEAPGAPADWFERAADAGDRQGAFLFAVALAEGDGREKDPARAEAIAAQLLASAQVEPDLRASVAVFLETLRDDAVAADTTD